MRYIINKLTSPSSKRNLSSIPSEYWEKFKPTEFTLSTEAKPVFVLEEKPVKPDRKEALSPPKPAKPPTPTPKLKQQDSIEEKLTKFGGEDFLEYIKSLEQEAESEQDEEKKKKIKSRINNLKFSIFELQDSERDFFQRVLLVLEVLKVVEVYPGLESDLRSKISEYKNYIVRLINSIGLHKDINKTFFTTLDTILVSQQENEDKTELIDIFSNLINKIIFSVEEQKKINNIMKLYGYYSDIGLTLSDMVVSGYNPSMSGQVNANSCFTTFFNRLTKYPSLYIVIKENMEKPEITRPSNTIISQNLEKMLRVIDSLVNKVNESAPQNLAEQARLAGLAAKAPVSAAAQILPKEGELEEEFNLEPNPLYVSAGSNSSNLLGVPTSHYYQAANNLKEEKKRSPKDELPKVPVASSLVFPVSPVSKGKAPVYAELEAAPESPAPAEEPVAPAAPAAPEAEPAAEPAAAAVNYENANIPPGNLYNTVNGNFEGLKTQQLKEDVKQVELERERERRLLEQQYVEMGGLAAPAAAAAEPAAAPEPAAEPAPESAPEPAKYESFENIFARNGNNNSSAA